MIGVGGFATGKDTEEAEDKQRRYAGNGRAGEPAPVPPEEFKGDSSRNTRTLEWQRSPSESQGKGS